MQKKYFTLVAATLVAGAAFGQSGPTIYGVADLSVESVSATGSTAGAVGNDIPSRIRLNANSSLFGVKGKVDVGGDNAVIYQFETYIDLGNNQYVGANAPAVGNTGPTVTTAGLSGSSTSVFGARRDTFVGMMGNWGTLKAGYMTTGFRGATAKCDLAPGATGVTAAYEVFGYAGAGKNWFQRYPSVMYTTPTFGGFSAALTYIPNTAKAIEAGPVDPGGWDLLARYETKLFHVTFVHTDLKDLTFGGFASESNKSDALFAGVNFPTGTTLSAMYNMSKATLLPTGAGATSFEMKQNSFYVGVKQVVGPHEFMLNFQSAPKHTGTNLPTTGALAANYAEANSGAKSIAARYAYNLFKNTQLFVVYAAITNEDQAAVNFNIGAVGGPGQLKAGADPKAFGGGLRFVF